MKLESPIATADASVAHEVPELPIYEIQGQGLRSPYRGQIVATRGQVTAILHDGFVIQAQNGGDHRDETSDAILVRTKDPQVELNDLIRVEGKVIEERRRAGELSSTRIGGEPIFEVLAKKQPPLKAQKLGLGGHQLGDGLRKARMQRSSMEYMLVEVVDPLVTGPSDRWGSLAVVPNRGLDSDLSVRGTLRRQHNKYNTQCLVVDVDESSTPDFRPKAQVGDATSNIVGILRYQQGNYEVVPTETYEILKGNLERETTQLVGSPNQLTVASLNVKNLDPKIEDPDKTKSPREVDDDTYQFEWLGKTIANNLQAPDIIALQEVQDNNGTEIDEEVDASKTFETLIASIKEAGGPEYAWASLPPESGADGGQPGGNIRVGYLYRPDRVSLVENSLERIGEDHDAFIESRKSLKAEFRFKGKEVVLFNNHFASKRGSTPLYGTKIPPTNGGEAQRTAQATLVNQRMVEAREAHESGAVVIGLGDLNETEYNEPVKAMTRGGFQNMMESLSKNERYTYIYNGESQDLDQFIIDQEHAKNTEFDIVHTNCEFSAQSSDHDATIGRITFDDLPAQEEDSEKQEEEPKGALAKITETIKNNVVGESGKKAAPGESESEAEPEPTASQD